MIKALAHVCIGCTDLAEVERFYIQALGFTKRFDFVKHDRRIGFYLQVAEHQFLEFFLADSLPPQAGPIRHLCLETDDLDATIARLREHGYETRPKQLGADRAWQAWMVNAPDRVAIEFHQYTPDCSQHTGRTCVVNW